MDSLEKCETMKWDTKDNNNYKDFFNKKSLTTSHKSITTLQFQKNNLIIGGEKETVFMKVKASRILPECIQQGILIARNNNVLEFRPLTNNFKNKSLFISLSRVSHVIKYRHLY